MHLINRLVRRVIENNNTGLIAEAANVHKRLTHERRIKSTFAKSFYF